MQSRFASKTLDGDVRAFPSTRWFDATLLPKDQVSQPDTAAGHVHHGTRRQHDHAHAGSRARHREARAAGRVRSLSDHLVGALGAQGRHLPAAGLHQLRDGRLAHGVEPLAAVGRADRGAGLRVEERLRHDVHARAASSASPTACSRTSRSRTARSSAEDILREINRGGWSTGYCGQSPERLKAHMTQPGEVRSRHAAGAEGRSGGRRRLSTACRGRAGARRSSSIRARRSSTTPTFR